MCGDTPGCPLAVPCPNPGRFLGTCPPPSLLGGFLGACPPPSPPRPAPGVPVGAGAAGDDGKWESKRGHGRDSDAGGLSHCRGGNSWGELVPRMGSQHPGWTHSMQAGLPAPRAHPQPSSPRGLLAAVLSSELDPRGKVALRPCPSCAWQHWDNSRLSSLCSGEIPALALQSSPPPSRDGFSSPADSGSCCDG